MAAVTGPSEESRLATPMRRARVRRASSSSTVDWPEPRMPIGGGAVGGENRGELARGVGCDGDAVLFEGVLTASDGGAAEAVLVAGLVVAEATADADLWLRETSLPLPGRTWTPRPSRTPSWMVQPIEHSVQVVVTHLSGARDPLVRGFHEGGGGADIDAGAAEVAVGLVDLAAGAEGDAGGEAAPGEGDRGGVSEVVAGAHAAGADDAHLRVELEEGVARSGSAWSKR